MKILGKSRGASALIVLASVLTAGVAAAQQPQAPAPTQAAVDPKATYASGEKKFKAGDYQGALADFQASNGAKPAPETDRYLGMTQDNLGNFAEAVAAYERFIAKVPANMKDEGEQAKKRVEAIKSMNGHVHVEATPGGVKVAIDGGQPADAKDFDLAPGKHSLRITADGYDAADKDVDVTYGSKQEVKVELTKNAAVPPVAPPVVAEQPTTQPPPPAPPPEPRSKIPAYVTGGVAIIAAGIGTGFGIKALGQSNDFKDNPTTKRADDGENNALVADMMFGIAITFGVTSAVLFLSSDPTSDNKDPKSASAKKKKSITITPAPYVTPHGGGVGTLVNF